MKIGSSTEEGQKDNTKINAIILEKVASFFVDGIHLVKGAVAVIKASCTSALKAPFC